MGIARMLRTLRDEFLDPPASTGRATAAVDDTPGAAKGPTVRLAAVTPDVAPPVVPHGSVAVEAGAPRRGLRQHPAMAAVLEADHADEGVLVGLTLGSHEAMERGIDRLRANFLGALQAARDDALDRCNGLQHSLLDVGTGSDLMIRKLKLELALCEREVAELDEQKALAIENDGRFRAVVHAYTEGFHRGQHEKHFGGGRFFK